MSTKKPSFEVDGKTYELLFNRKMHLAWDEATAKKRKDAEYQREVAEIQKLQENATTLQKKFYEARDKWLENPTDEQLKAARDAIKEAYDDAYREYMDYATTHSATDNVDKELIDNIEQLVILGLETQYELKHDEAVKIWESYVTEAGENEAIEFLIDAGKCWIVADDEEESGNPFIQAMREKERAKEEAARNRKAGINKVNR